MVMIANYQYGWTFFVPDIQKKFGWDRASIQWPSPCSCCSKPGWCRSKAGSSINTAAPRGSRRGICCAIGWAINAQATTLNGYYLGMIIAGIGAGGVYGTCVGKRAEMVSRQARPRRRPSPPPVSAPGSALTVAPIQAMIVDSGFQTTFLYFGLGTRHHHVLLAFFLFSPKPDKSRR